ncbi:asparagine synthase (glutamine-hydrolyzing) [uncultured Pontibacter sp.]|uniref:asparagine synthase (glutamine-hydrolyzing) n=1 Tax=uncultured Pontibacter sp. TaxID=453356 RepID=UPI0026330073|nr:asparagine synthase (glutamine-hydrolyzing) [uncultured Pontibacter sp.]
MFGIAGVYAFTATGNEALQGLERRVRALQNSDNGNKRLYQEGQVGLAGSAQTFQDPTGRYIMVYQGEVLNCRDLRTKLQSVGYTFHTDTDAEVILRLYIKEGQEFLKRLRGYFALAVYDKVKDSLFIARDRYGEKPLLYYRDADKFLFGSDMAALLELGVPREVDQTSLYQYLQLGYVPAPASMLKGVKKLLPGHFLYLKDNKLHQKMWHRLPYDSEKAATNPLSYTQQQAKLEKLLEQAVVGCLGTGDPPGVLLDGSIESCITTALASKHLSQLKTFSIGFAGQADTDVLRHARLVANRYKTEHTEYLVTTQDMYASLPGFLNCLSEPFADSSALAEYILGGRASQEVRIVLSGNGTDELFAGCERHLAEYQLISGGVKVGVAKSLGFLLNLLPNPRNSFAANKVRQLRQFSKGAGMPHRERYWQWASLANESEALALLEPKLARSVRNRLYLARKQRLLSCLEENHHNLNNVLCADWQLELANVVLPKIDLIGMANGLEIRSPFLDHKIVKFAFSLPVSSKIDATQRKKILHDTFKSLLPKELTNKPKQGFELPLQQLLQTEARLLVESYLSDDFIRRQGIFDPGQVQRLRVGMASSRSGEWQSQVWSLLVFQHWWQKWML